MKTTKILIVDSVKAALNLYRQALKPLGFEVTAMDNGKEAVEAVNAGDIDLIITDINLVDMTGFAFLDKIKYDNPAIPIVLLTASGLKNEIIRTGGYNIKSVLVKPIDLEQMKQRVRTVIEKSDDTKKEEDKRKLNILDSLAGIQIDNRLPKEIIQLKTMIKEKAVKLKNIEVEENSKSKLESSLWQKECSCPICGTSFVTLNYKTKSLPVLEKESDFHEIYEVINPLVFDIWVCPECLYAAKKDEFESLDIKLIEKLAKSKQVRKEIAKGLNFYEMRNHDLGIASYKLAIECYNYRKPSNAFIGSMYLKAAWIAREKGDMPLEMEFMKSVTENYENALSKGEQIGGQLSELGLIYLLGELYRRLGDIDKALRYFMKVKQDPESNNEKAILRMASDQMDLIKEERKNKTKENK